MKTWKGQFESYLFYHAATYNRDIKEHWKTNQTADEIITSISSMHSLRRDHSIGLDASEMNMLCQGCPDGPDWDALRQEFPSPSQPFSIRDVPDQYVAMDSTGWAGSNRGSAVEDTLKVVLEIGSMTKLPDTTDVVTNLTYDVTGGRHMLTTTSSGHLVTGFAEQLEEFCNGLRIKKSLDPENEGFVFAKTMGASMFMVWMCNDFC